ncbi:putative aspartic-type endopeptidase opsB, partial [Neolecta irregularis DAH-3]
MLTARCLPCGSNRLVTIGTPPQRLSLQIDTGSSDIWTQVSSSVLCNSQGDPCSVSGTYNNLTSSSYQYVNSDFLIQYGDGTGAQGDYCKETLGIAGVSINGVQIALGLAATSTEGVLGIRAQDILISLLGIGYSTNQAISIFQGQSGYPSLLDNMVSKKLIAARAFSLYLDDLNANTGSLLFGGIDTAKYSGDLLTLPVLNDGSTFTSFAVAMTSLSITKPGSNSATTLAASSFPISVILDSGS